MNKFLNCYYKEQLQRARVPYVTSGKGVSWSIDVGKTLPNPEPEDVREYLTRSLFWSRLAAVEEILRLAFPLESFDFMPASDLMRWDGYRIVNNNQPSAPRSIEELAMALDALILHTLKKLEQSK